jgi:hypothetical protein
VERDEQAGLTPARMPALTPGVVIGEPAPVPVEVRPKAGRILSALVVDGRVSITVRVREDGGDREYTASLPVDVLVRFDRDEQRRALVEAVRLERDRVKRLESIDLAALTGDVEFW